MFKQAAQSRPPLRLGMVGFSPGNGHPISFSAIVNGYDDEGMAAVGWDGIHAYLRKADVTEVGLSEAEVTHIWTQDQDLSRQVARAARIANVVATPADMLNEIDALVIARDDQETHFPIAMPALEKGLPVFVDKPLTTDKSEFAAFMPYLASGQLMSCSGLRYARELDPLRARPDMVGKWMSVHCGVVNGWERYGVHMIDAVLGVFTDFIPESVSRRGQCWTIAGTAGGEDRTFTVSCLGSDAPLFRILALGSRDEFTCRISDNFSAFKRTLSHFLQQVDTGVPAVPPQTVRHSIATLMAGLEAKDAGKPICVQSMLPRW